MSGPATLAVADGAALLASGWIAALVAFAAAAAGVGRARRVGALAARASHEVRGPLTAAQLALDGLTVRGEVDACRTLALELQLRRARRALDDLSLSPGARTTPDRPEALALASLAAELEATWRPVVAARGRELVLEAAATGVVIVDRGRLAQAAGNLVANALEHGSGTVRLAVGVAPGGRRARITVSDGGPGPGPLPERLGMCAPVVGPLPPRGHGLGVAADVARRAGGRLVAHGARLTLELPLAEEPAAPPPGATSHAPGCCSAAGLGTGV